MHTSPTMIARVAASVARSAGIGGAEGQQDSGDERRRGGVRSDHQLA